MKKITIDVLAGPHEEKLLESRLGRLRSKSIITRFQACVVSGSSALGRQGLLDDPGTLGLYGLSAESTDLCDAAYQNSLCSIYHHKDLSQLHKRVGEEFFPRCRRYHCLVFQSSCCIESRQEVPAYTLNESAHPGHCRIYLSDHDLSSLVLAH